MADEKKCFVIMPITMPGPMIEKYHDGKDHFHHVYHYLFEPSIRKAGYTPIPPKAEGSDVIHAGIIGNLESANLVLCDMSCLNPNVFFEWGIRTALNKPVCIVKDELATNVPFDTTMLNYHPYGSTLHGWEIEAEREKLTAHLTASATKAGNENALWKYFGLSSKGQPYQTREGSDGRLDYLSMQVESIRRRLESMWDNMVTLVEPRDPVYLRDKSPGGPWNRAKMAQAIDLVLAAEKLPNHAFQLRVLNRNTHPFLYIKPRVDWPVGTKSHVESLIHAQFGIPTVWLGPEERIVKSDSQLYDD